MSRNDRASWIPLYEMDSTTIVPATFKLLVNGLPEACFAIKLINDCDQTIFLSWDTTYINDVIQDYDTLELYSQANAGPSNYVSRFKKGQKFYVTLHNVSNGGNIYFCAYY